MENDTGKVEAAWWEGELNIARRLYWGARTPSEEKAAVARIEAAERALSLQPTKSFAERHAQPSTPTATAALLDERGKTHGSFKLHAQTTQALKRKFYAPVPPGKLTPEMREAVDMILHKLGRIAAGDPTHADHWADIAGYAELVVKALDRAVKDR